MADISTPSTPVLTKITDTPQAHGPKLSTLAFLRQFARCYSPAAGDLILN